MKGDTIASLNSNAFIFNNNTEMNTTQECEDELNQKGAMVSRLQAKASQIGNILSSLERKYDKGYMGNHDGTIREEEGETDKLKKSNSASQIVGDRGEGGHKKRYSMRIDPIPPFNPNKQRKSEATASPQTTETVEPIVVAPPATPAETSTVTAAIAADDSKESEQPMNVESTDKADATTDCVSASKDEPPEEMTVEVEVDETEMSTDNQ